MSIKLAESPGTFVTLQNLGNTCFLNAIIQCLDSICELKYSIFIDTQTSKKAKRKLMKCLKQNSTKHDYELGHLIVQTLNVMRMHSDRCILQPTDLVRVLRKYQIQHLGYNQLEIFRQQDAHECINLLLDAIHNTISESTVNASVMSRADPESFYDVVGHDLAGEWVKYINCHGDSGIVRSFFGQTATVVECQSCTSRSWKYQPSWTVHLPIPTTEGPGHSVDIKDCFRKFMEVEIMDGENMYQCDKCNRKVIAKKKEVIGTPPNVLIIHLKRFHNCGAVKNNTLVTFPVSKTLDLTNEVLIANNALANYDEEFGETVHYRLNGVINHFGTLHAGHYTASCRKNNTSAWFYYDDQVMKYIPQPDKQIVIPAAYILFYTRIV